MSVAAMLLGGLLLDIAFGWPDRLYARIGHPVTWIGAVIDGLDRRLNRGSRARRLWAGAAVAVIVPALAVLPAAGLAALLPEGPAGLVLGALLVWPLLACRSMYTHVVAVAEPLETDDLGEARHAVSMIVGRDPARLDAAGIARAATESLAENSSDGIVAPLFWGVVAGLPGIAAYKAVNTLDSMIGHRSPRFEAFGKASARLDDLANLVPARLMGLLFVLAAGREGPRAFSVMRRDGPGHRSPNAGWPEAAMAGALGVRLSGPRAYATDMAEEPWLNPGAPDPGPAEIRRALSIYRRAMALAALALAVLALI